MPLLGLPFSIKALSQEGEFSGLASIYGIEDLGGDVVEPGAFTRTLSEKGKKRPLLWLHDAPIGLVELSDTGAALAVKGQLTMALQAAKDARALMMDGAVSGLSIGYQSVRAQYIEGVRHLFEVKLWEISLVPYPMLEEASVTGIKAADRNRIQLAIKEFRNGILGAFNI